MKCSGLRDHVCSLLSNNSTKTKINTHRGEGKPMQQNGNNCLGREDMSIHCPFSFSLFMMISIIVRGSKENFTKERREGGREEKKEARGHCQ